MNLPHRVHVYREETVPDGQGGWIVEWVLIGTVPGRFGVIDSQQVEIARWTGEEITGSVRVPHGSDVQATDTLEVDGHPGVDGTFEVTEVRPNPDHLRLMCSS